MWYFAFSADHIDTPLWWVVDIAPTDLRAPGVPGKDAQRRRICRCVEAEDIARAGGGRRGAASISSTHH